MHSITILPTDIEKQPEHVFDGYPFASTNGFLIGKDHGKIVEVVEIQGEQFRRHLPPIPAHSYASFQYSTSDVSTFPCCNFPERILFTGESEEHRILELRLTTFRKYANELKEVTANMKSILQKIDELTNAGDLASCFQYHEQLNKQTNQATGITRTLVSLKDSNMILINSLELKMKAAGEIAEYQQAQTVKVSLERYTKLRNDILQNTASLPSQTIVAYGDALESALQLCNYLTD